MRVGFIGLGKMGRPMSLNLIKAGFSLTVHNRSRSVVDELAAVGATPAGSPAEVAAASDIVLTCLPTPAAVEEVYLGRDGLVESARNGQILVDHSTVSPSLNRSIAVALVPRTAKFIDAPVSGGPEGAAAATLTIMVGGDDEDFRRTLPILQAMGKNVYHVGPVGAGSVLKLANQLMVGINMAGAVEAIVLAAKGGADTRMALEVIRNSWGASAMFDRGVPRIVDRNFKAGASVSTLLKDLTLIGDMARENSVRLLMGSIAAQVFSEAKALGLSDLDVTALALPLERIAGITVK